MQSLETNIGPVFLNLYDLIFHDTAQVSDPFSNHPRFSFSQTGSIVCCFTANQLYCHFPNTKVFSWNTSEANSLFSNLKNWPTDVPLSWKIADVTFLPNSSQLLLLLAPPENSKPLRSIICLVDLNDGTKVSFQRFISIRGKAELIHLVSTEQSTLTGFQGAVAIALDRGHVVLLDLCLNWNIPKNTYLEPSVRITIEQCVQCIADDERVSPLTSNMEHSLVNLNGKFMGVCIQQILVERALCL